MQNRDDSPVAQLFSLDFPRSLAPLVHTLGFRTVAEDFQVTEILGFAPDGDGEHLLLRVRKTNENTRWIAHQLAEHYAVGEESVGYCGMKDRRAVAMQWFSVHLPGKTVTAEPAIPGCEVLESARNRRKLKPGMHAGNQFVITLRGEGAVQDDINGRLEAIARRGVPNYFGEQRFGRDGNNLLEVSKIVASPNPRFKGRRGGLYLSAARSWLFNQVLASQVVSDQWQQIADGPLWGRGRSKVDQQLAEVEAEILAPWQDWCLALEHSGLSQERRALVLQPQDFSWQWQDSNLVLSFTLLPGGYATAILRELALLTSPALEFPGAAD